MADTPPPPNTGNLRHDGTSAMYQPGSSDGTVGQAGGAGFGSARPPSGNTAPGGSLAWAAQQRVDPLVELGNSGLKAYSGYIFEEFLPSLQGRKAVQVYREMTDNEPVVGAILFAIQQSLRGVKWRWTSPEEDLAQNEPRPTMTPKDEVAAAQDGAPPGESDVGAEPGKTKQNDQDDELVKFCESLFDDMDHTFEDFVTEVLTMLSYGYAPMEIVLKRRNGLNPEDDPDAQLAVNLPHQPKSRYEDGKIGIHKLALRGQDTVLHWHLAKNGEILGLV